MIPDAYSFDAIAMNLASGSGYTLDGLPTAGRPPAYVMFLSAIYKVAGHHYRVARLAQAVLGVGLVWVLMGITRELGWSARLTGAVGWM